MTLDADFFKKLVDTFKVELDEKLQSMTDGLLNLEQGNLEPQTSDEIIEEIFRAAHNIKGASRGVGISDIGEIAHGIESIFASIRDKQKTVTADIISLCLHAVDGMHAVMNAFSDNKSLEFDLAHLIEQLSTGELAPAASFSNDPTFEKKIEFKKEQKGNSIRVSLEQIEHVSALLEELQVNKIAIDAHYADLMHLTSKIKRWMRNHSLVTDQLIETGTDVNLMRKHMQVNVSSFTTILDSLQDEIRRLRLIPASTLLRDIARSVRDLAKDLNKKVTLEISGDGIKMDKMILEGLKDPIIHLLRNAIDHGIESAHIRQQRGKSESGHINIEVIDEGDQIYLIIRDDGAGIDSAKIAQIAIQNNIASKADIDKMNENDLLSLIFLPGFSTKDTVTDISGRGIGLDVVKANLTSIRGDVVVSTEPGKGTTFQLQVPLTLSSDVGLTIKSAGQYFVIPTSSVERVMRINQDSILEVEASQVILVDEKPIPLRRLADILLLDEPKSALNEQLPIVVLKKGRDIIALLVDEIVGEQEIVIKPLCPPLVNVSCVAGGTLSGNGDISIVLSAGDIINIATHSHKNHIPLQEGVQVTNSQCHILLVDDSITTRTLEKNILENNHYRVTTAVDGREAWNLLQNETNTFSLLITDIEMPNMTGLELTERVKNDAKLCEIPVIIVTSLGNDAQKKHGIELGANAYIVKHDFESKELLEIIGQLV